MENIDRISCLHDSILSHILSFLPIEEAVGTSVLSTRWRYLFSLLPNIDFELDEELRRKYLNCWWTDTPGESFRSFVDRMLSFDNTTKLDKFRLKVRMKVDSNQIYPWISAAVQRGIKHLDLSIFFREEKPTLPDLLFTCRKLTTLKLKILNLDLHVPKGVYFPNLKTLHLKSVFLDNDFDLVPSLFSACTSLEDMVLSPLSDFDFDSDDPPKIFNLPGCRTLVTLKLDFNFVLDVPKGVHFPKLQTLHLSVEFFNEGAVTNLLSGCHSLEDMAMIRCGMRNIKNFNISHHLLKRLTVMSCWNFDCSLMIDTPNLAYFKYSHSHIEASHSLNLPSLIKADIEMDHYKPQDFQAEPTALFFRGMCNVRSLILSANSLQHLLSSRPLPVFATLVELEIHYDIPHIDFSFFFSCHYNHWEDGLETLLKSCGELENLVIYQEILCSLPENASLLSKLKVIEISNFKDNKYCIRKAKYILNNGAALEKLKICTTSYGEFPSYEGRAKKLSKISNALLASPRRSEQCCISII